ncbi:hypothetical protein F5880DRAFT_1502239 [Lentinula raphanica]|nr:hypothetical protein F5880DRAFT_1502239 [Lentinula raphanica]
MISENPEKLRSRQGKKASREEARENESREEGKDKLRNGLQKRTKSTYAEVTSGLCVGLENCWVYQKKPNGEAGIQTSNIHPQTRTEKSELQHDSHYHKQIKVSISNTFHESREDLFNHFSTLENLHSALSSHHISDVVISDGESMSSAMLRLMQAMKMITGYNEAQTLEQNIVLSGRPLVATLRFGYLGISRNPPTIDVVWRRFDTRSADGNTVQTEESEIQASDEAILQMDGSEEGIEAAAKPDVSPKEMRELDERSIALCHGYAVAAIDPVMRAKTVVGRPDSPNSRFHPMLNLRLDDVHVGLQSKEYTKQFREELKDITKLEKSTRITITNETLLIHAILTRLTNAPGKAEAEKVKVYYILGDSKACYTKCSASVAGTVLDRKIHWIESSSNMEGHIYEENCFTTRDSNPALEQAEKCLEEKVYNKGISVHVELSSDWSLERHRVLAQYRAQPAPLPAGELAEISLYEFRLRMFWKK